MKRAALTLGLSLTYVQAHAAPAGDADRGEGLFRQCAACHQVGPEAVNRVGPQLNHVFDRPAGAAEGFRYSKALIDAAANGLTWGEATLDAFLENPRAAVAGTKMSFRGLADPQDRADMIAYLHRFSDETPDAAAPTAGFTVSADVLAIVGDPAYGEYLSGDCTSCHQLDGADAGIPAIVHWPTDVFVTAMHAYKSGVRTHPVMQMMAGRLSDDEIAALAAYFKDVE